jgi:hypothetical protein
MIAPATTATDSIFAARRALGLKRVTAISPHTQVPAAFKVGDGAALSAGPAHVRNLFAHLALVPAQNSRDLLYREAAQEQVAQLGQLRIRPLPDGVHWRRFVVSVRPRGARIDAPIRRNSASCSGFRGPLRKAPISTSVHLAV